MKRKSIFSLLLLSIVLGLSTTSCKDMLSSNDERNAYTVAQDTLYSYWGILESLQNVAERYVILNECRGDLVSSSEYVSDTISAICNFGMNADTEEYKDGACAYLQVRDYYHIINSCNAYIAMCDTTLQTGTGRSYMMREYAQVQAIRAWVYMQLVYQYGRVPFYDKPMLTTDEINHFDMNDANNYVDAKTLVYKFADILQRMAQVEKTLGLPEYYQYGDVDKSKNVFVCHSSKCMFPVNLVLGDLYLMEGSQTSCAKAAQCYYDYINTEDGGPISATKFYSYANVDEKKDKPYYYYSESYSSTPYNDKDEVSRSTEAITCIPSNRGKLDGKVNKDINRLFGFEPSLTTSNSSNSDVAVSLRTNLKRELLPSNGYEQLCDDQTYEIYTGTSNDNPTDMTLTVLPNTGDARRVWIYRDGGTQWTMTYNVGETEEFGKMVSKQNPGGSFSTTYPVIYRKSTVWLHYAEALNRAGFPSYAFAILKNGLINTYDWIPSKQSELQQLQYENPYKYRTSNYSYPVKEGEYLYCYYDALKGLYIPEGWKDTEKITTYDDLKARVDQYFQEEYNASLATTEPMTEPRTFDANYVCGAPSSPNAFYNYTTPTDCSDVCYYLDRREVEKAPSYLNFSGMPYLMGQSYSQKIYWKEQLLSGKPSTKTWPTSTYSDVTYTIGIHQRGCGLLLSTETNSSYNYVDQINKKIVENGGTALTCDQIYGGDYDAEVQDAVEDLIVDEMALELAFEGNRFSDLCRVALRRGDNSYLAKRVAKRSGQMDASLYSYLLDRNHWYLPLPQE